MKLGKLFHASCVISVINITMYNTISYFTFWAVPLYAPFLPDIVVSNRNAFPMVPLITMIAHAISNIDSGCLTLWSNSNLTIDQSNSRSRDLVET